MINSYNILSKCNKSIKRVLVLSLILSALLFESAVAQTEFQTISSNDVRKDLQNSNLVFTSYNKSSTIEGKFIIKDGYVDDVKSFNLAMPLANANEFFAENFIDDSLEFELTHVMVLTEMKLIHIIGFLNVAGVSKRTELDFNYIVNEDQSLSLSATKKIKLSDFNNDAKFSALAIKNNNELDLNFNFLLENKNQNLIAAN